MRDLMEPGEELILLQTRAAALPDGLDEFPLGVARGQVADTYIVAEAADGDRILIMGARDDTLIDFARMLVERLAQRN